MAKEINPETARRLFDSLGVTVENVHPRPKQHRGEVLFCGYADILLWVFSEGEALPLARLSGNAIKTIGGNLHFDPKGEPGKGDRKGQFFHHWVPLSPESRAVLTVKLSRLPEIKELVAIATGRTETTTEK